MSPKKQERRLKVWQGQSVEESNYRERRVVRRERKRRAREEQTHLSVSQMEETGGPGKALQPQPVPQAASVLYLRSWAECLLQGLRRRRELQLVNLLLR